MSHSLTEMSSVRITNEFSEQSSFENIHSYRVVMSFLAVVDLIYPDLELSNHEDIISYFHEKLANKPDYLNHAIDYGDFAEAWNVKNPKSNKQNIKKLAESYLIQSSIRSNNSLVQLFAEAILEDDKIRVMLNPRAMPYLLNAHRTKDGFISPVPLKYFHSFRSTITAKLFERMLRFIDSGVLYFTEESLKKYTGSSSSEYKALKRDVLVKAKKEFDELDFIEEFSFEEEFIGVGRKKTLKRIIVTYSMPEILSLKKANIERKNYTDQSDI